MKKRRFQTEIEAAVSLHRAGRASEAARRFSQLLDAAPLEPDALNEVGLLAIRLGHLAEGISWLGRSLMVDPAQARIWAIRGVGLNRLRRSAEALADLDRAIELQPAYADAFFDRGCILRDLGRLADALVDFDAALALDFRNAPLHANRGALLHEMGRETEAVESNRRALAIDPQYVPAYYNLGITLEALGRPDEALQSYAQAIAVDPGHPRTAPVHANRALLLHQQGRRDEAAQSFARAFAADRECAQAHFCQAVALEESARCDEALGHYDRALAADPQHAGAHWNRALLNLSRGDFEEGWRGYEWRWRGTQRADSWLLDSPLRWTGGQALAGKTILLIAEQGLGDTLQFCRYATLAAERGARVLLEVQRPLQTLLESLPGVAGTFAIGDPRPEFDCLCPLLSLPLEFGTTLGRIPGRIPYLRADEHKVRQWRTRLGPTDKLRVGLVWSGGFRPDQPATWAVNARRNIPLRLLAPLRHPAIEFFSLQKGEPGESEWAALRSQSWDGPVLADWTSELHDFSDTAALIENLDLLISVDTSTAHLAGALGKPVWILNRFDSCWRWLRDRHDSPWYPSARLYRQSAPGAWEGVIQCVREDLLQRAARAPT